MLPPSNKLSAPRKVAIASDHALELHRRMMVRPSMEKFMAEARKIEVVGFARYLPAFLNRQIISILFQKSLGVPDMVFQELQV